MDNLGKIIKGYIDNDKSQDHISLKYMDAVVTSVREDFLRADVRFVTGQTIKNMLNKSGDELVVGQGVKIGYQTSPSKGWIAMAYGESKPLGGGGAGINVESAAIVTDEQDFIINREVMIDYSPATKVLYGSSPSFFIVNGNYAYFFNGLLRDGNNKDIVIAHSQYFGGGLTLRGIAYDPAIEGNEYNLIDITFDTRIETMSLSNSGGTIQYYENAGIYAIGTYGVPSERKNNRFALLQNMAYRQNGWVEDIILVPRVNSLFQPTDENVKALLPEGTTFVMEIVLEMLWKIGSNWNVNYYPPTISPYNIGWSKNNTSKFYACFKNQAEQDFALGITQRIEPIEVTP